MQINTIQPLNLNGYLNNVYPKPNLDLNKHNTYYQTISNRNIEGVKLNVRA